MLLLLLTALAASPARGKVYELYTRPHFHDMLLDTPIGFRPASLIAFYDESRKGCAKRDLNKFFDDYALPSVDNLLVARYEISTSHDRVWHEWEDMLDLPLHLGLGRVPLSKDSAVDASRALANESCPTLAFLPAAYANELGAWYLNDPKYTRQNGKLQIWDKKKEADWRKWLWGNLKLDSLNIVNREPFQVVVAVKPNPQRLHEMGTSQTDAGARIVTVDGIDNYVSLSDVYVGDSLHIIFDESGEMAQCSEARDCEPKPESDALGEGITVMAANDYDLSGKSVKVHLVHELVGATRRVAFDAGSARKHSPLSTKLIAKRHSTTCMTHTRNLVMPKVLPHFHEIGFKKIQMPAGFHQRLKRFYRTHYGKRHVEGWDNVGTQLNCDQVSTHMVSLDNDFSERNSIAMDVIQPILEEWVNASIDFSSFYGIREYHEGAVLRNHCDRMGTHVVSSILQIAQSDIPETDDPWTLEVYAFDGKRMNLALKPGEMVLYEGHALVHGRPKPMQGEKYVNAFCHFRPKDYAWTEAKAYKSDIGKRTLQLLHVDGIQDLYG